MYFLLLYYYRILYFKKSQEKKLSYLRKEGVKKESKAAFTCVQAARVQNFAFNSMIRPSKISN